MLQEGGPWVGLGRRWLVDVCWSRRGPLGRAPHGTVCPSPASKLGLLRPWGRLLPFVFTSVPSGNRRHQRMSLKVRPHQ